MIQSRRYLYKRSLFFLIDKDLADQLEVITCELREMLPDHLQEEFGYGKLCELCFIALLNNYKENGKEKSIFAQVVKIWEESGQ